jgi:hypothetical protein
LETPPARDTSLNEKYIGMFAEHSVLHPNMNVFVANLKGRKMLEFFKNTFSNNNN